MEETVNIAKLKKILKLSIISPETFQRKMNKGKDTTTALRNEISDH